MEERGTECKECQGTEGIHAGFTKGSGERAASEGPWEKASDAEEDTAEGAVANAEGLRGWVRGHED